MKLILLGYITDKQIATFDAPDFIPAIGAKVQVMEGGTESTYIVRDQRVKYHQVGDDDNPLFTDAEVTLLCQLA